MELTVKITPRVAAQVARRLRLAASVRSRSMSAIVNDALDEALPSLEEIRMQLYQEHLDAGVRSHIDPRRDPAGFRKAGEKGIRAVHITGHDQVLQPAGSGSSH